MNLSKWNSFITEQDESTAKDPVLQTTNTTARQEMLANSDDDTIIVPRGVMVEEHILSEMGFTLGRKLGEGKYGAVYMAQDETTGRRLAVKLIMGSTYSDAQREVTNYKFLINNRDKLGNGKKYFPKVYSSELKRYKFAPSEMNPSPPLYDIGIILMELLAPLPKRIKTDLLATGGLETGPQGRFARQRVDFTARDKRLFKNPNVVFDLAKYSIKGSQLLQNLARSFFTEMVDTVSKKVVERFVKNDYQDIDEEAYSALQYIVSDNWLESLASWRAQVLFLLTLTELHSYMFPEGGQPKVAYMNDSLIGMIYNQVFNSFLRGYVRPVVPGTLDPDDSREIMKPQDSSALEEFPEAVNFVQFMQDMKQIGIVGRDMHVGNFLMRPSDNEIVVVDLGLFKIQDAVEIKDKGDTVPFFERKR
jgi:serine/threonine protein kinase